MENKNLCAIDYSDPGNWGINDYNNPEKADTAADVIFFYGTATSADVEENGILQICDGMKTFAEFGYKTGASAFDDGVRMYMPYYRQLSLAAELTCSSSTETAELLKTTVVAADAYAVMDYYFENYNDGRPFILSGFSQGGNIVLTLLDEYFGEEKNRAYLNRMVAAYSIGFGVDKNWLEKHDYLKFAEGADDTGVIVSWNTEGPGEKGQNPLLATNPSDTLVINPINWKRDGTYASASECLGTYVDGEIVTPGLYNLQIDTERGSVICDNNTDYMDDGTGTMWGGKSLHTYEMRQVYLSLRKNMHDRLDAFEKSAPL